MFTSSLFICSELSLEGKSTGQKSIELEEDVTKKNINKINIKSVIEDILKLGLGLFFELKFI